MNGRMWKVMKGGVKWERRKEVRERRLARGLGKQGTTEQTYIERNFTVGHI